MWCLKYYFQDDMEKQAKIISGHSHVLGNKAAKMNKT